MDKESRNREERKEENFKNSISILKLKKFLETKREKEFGKLMVCYAK